MADKCFSKCSHTSANEKKILASTIVYIWLQLSRCLSLLFEQPLQVHIDKHTDTIKKHTNYPSQVLSIGCEINDIVESVDSVVDKRLKTSGILCFFRNL